MEFFDDQGMAGRFPSMAFSTAFSNGRQERKSKAAFRSPVHAGNRAARRALASAERAEKVYMIIKRRVYRELGLDREVDIWGRSFRIRMKAATKRTVKSVSLALKGRAAGRAIMTYSKPIRDQRGRVAVFMRVRYKGFKSPGWRAGMTAEHAHYIYRREAIEPEFRDAPLLSNMGDSIDEVAIGWEALEEVEKAYRANAIVQHRIVLGMPYQLTPAGRRRALERFCERAFDRHGLPFAASNHLPDADGDQRNYHAHVAFSTRPMAHIGGHLWEIVQEKVNGITDPDGLARMRALFAAIVNQECRREGLDLRLTHQRFDKRGIDARRQEHLGPQLTSLHRQGEAVDMVVRNERIITENEAREEHRQATKEINDASKQIAQLEQDLHAFAMREKAENDFAEERRRDLKAKGASKHNGQNEQLDPMGATEAEERPAQGHSAKPGRPAYTTLEELRMNELKEKAVRQLSSDEGADLLIRLERERPLLQSKSGLIQPVDTRLFTEAELAWMHRDLLTMHRLLREQQQEEEAAEEQKEQVRRAMEVRRLSALDRDASQQAPKDVPITDAAASVDPALETPALTPPDAKEGLGTESAVTPSKPAPQSAIKPEATMDQASQQAAAAALAAAKAGWGH